MAESTCPHCGMPIYDAEALLCHFCGESLGRPSQGAMGQLRYKHRWMWGAVAVLAAAAFILLTVF